MAAFTHFAGVIAAVAYDNLTAAVAKVLLGAPRVLRPRFAALVAHYALEARFCRPGEGHDKGASRAAEDTSAGSTSSRCRGARPSPR